jgi:hypothetical protein
LGVSNPVIATSPGEGARFPKLQTKREKYKKKGEKKEKKKEKSQLVKLANWSSYLGSNESFLESAVASVDSDRIRGMSRIRGEPKGRKGRKEARFIWFSVSHRSGGHPKDHINLSK